VSTQSSTAIHSARNCPCRQLSIRWVQAPVFYIMKSLACDPAERPGHAILIGKKIIDDEPCFTYFDANFGRCTFRRTKDLANYLSRHHQNVHKFRGPTHCLRQQRPFHSVAATQPN
jgi:hypothetical protein